MKHMTAAWQDEKVARLADEGGIEAYGFYWRMLEIVAANMTETSEPVCKLPAKSWARLCNLLSNRFERLAQLLQKCGLCRLESFEGLLKVEFPNLTKYRDEYSKKQTKKSAKNPDNIPTVSGQCPEQEQIQNQSQKQSKKEKQTKKPIREIDQDFLNDLSRDYPRVSLESERKLAEEWILDNPGRKFSRSFFRGWVKRASERMPPPDPNAYHGEFINAEEEEIEKAGEYYQKLIDAEAEQERLKKEAEDEINA